MTAIKVKNINWGKILAAILVCQLAGILGSLVTFEAIPTWYASLEKPFFAPPNVVFGPVWTILYTFMGISLYIIWMSKGVNKNKAIIIFTIQLVLNSLWSIIFFGLRNPGLAFFEIIVMWFSIFYTIKMFRRISMRASYLLYPYLAWVSFATILNLFIWLLNL